MCDRRAAMAAAVGASARDTKRVLDPKVAREAQEWIEAVTGDAFVGKDFHDSLRDGLLLCK